MSKVLKLRTLVAGAAMLALATAMTSGAEARGKGNPHPGPIVFVTSQGLFYDSIVLAMLPPKGPFQLLEMAGPSGLQTEFGPGDREFVGGRWWVDLNHNEEMDSGDMYFSCPLLGPGRAEM